MSVRILVDSASDITSDYADKLDITILPLTVSFGEVSYKDGVDLDHAGFYEKLIETDVLPKTSQISPFEYSEHFKAALESADEVLCITLSSKLSGSYQSANIAAEDFNGKVVIVDSENVTVGERILTELAVNYRNEGKNASEIKEILDVEKKNIRLIALLDTLEYLKKGGRISSTVAMAGTLLSIKPVIAIQNGEVAFLGMARGSKNGSNKLVELIQKEGGINFAKPMCMAYTGLNRDLLDKYINDSAHLYAEHKSELPVSSVGCSIGTHVGPGAICACFYING